MKTKIIIFCGMLTAIHLLLLQPCQGASFFAMALKHDSIYTPGKMNLTLKLTDNAKIESNYRFQVSIYVADKLMRKQVLSATKNEPVAFKLSFPEIFSKTDVRCRAELFLNGQFIEAREKLLILWPPLAAYPQKPEDKIMWVFDTSGQLQKIFGDLEVKITDATFQAVRNFETPDIVFLGQDLDPNSMLVITDRLALSKNKLVTIFLKQKQLPLSTNIEIPKENNWSTKVICDINSPLLQGLSKFDVMNMVDDTAYIKIKKQKDEDLVIDSYVTEITKGRKNIYSYLLMVEKDDGVVIYCQLPVTDHNDPRYIVLLENILRLANKISDSQKI